MRPGDDLHGEVVQVEIGDLVLVDRRTPGRADLRPGRRQLDHVRRDDGHVLRERPPEKQQHQHEEQRRHAARQCDIRASREPDAHPVQHADVEPGQVHRPAGRSAPCRKPTVSSAAVFNPTWFYAGAVYAAALARARRAVIDLPRKLAVFFYALVFVFLYLPLTQDYVNLPVDFLRTLPPWAYTTSERVAANGQTNDIPL